MRQSVCQKIDSVFSWAKCPLRENTIAFLIGERRSLVARTLKRMVSAGLLVRDGSGRVRRLIKGHER
ncbi:MAG: hypothetical protein LBG29_10060 [Synergistaceae bacterium]|jgi:predicted transcriptional regulator|nr:hypothetical protein [Synergistaceae bacterium]